MSADNLYRHNPPRRVIVTEQRVKLFDVDSGTDIAAGGTAIVTVAPRESCVPDSIRLREDLLEQFKLEGIWCGVEPMLAKFSAPEDDTTTRYTWTRPWRMVLLERGMDFAVKVTNVTSEPLRFEAEVQGHHVAKNATVAPGTKVVHLLDDDTGPYDVPSPLSDDALQAAASTLWLRYAEDRAADFAELSAEVQRAMHDCLASDADGARNLADQARLLAHLAADREGTFSDAFALGAAFVAGAAATVRVGADDSGNSESYKGIGIALNCSMFGDDFGNVIVMLAKEHGIEPLPDNATSGEWEGRCAVVLVVDGVGAYDATRLGNAALAHVNSEPAEGTER